MSDAAVSGTHPSKRSKPNILITGTPGTGKTSTAELLADKTDFKHINVTQLIHQHKCYDGHDDELDTHILDEDKLLDIMEAMLEESMEQGVGVVCDYHGSELFPERWFDLVLVLRTNTETLFDRLSKRNYKEKKLDQNMQCEILQVLLDEAKEAYAEEIVHEVPSNTPEDMDANVDRMEEWAKQWVANKK